MAPDELLQLDSLPHADRVRSAKVKGGVAMVIADATGLAEAERSALEDELRAAAERSPGVTRAKVALTVSEPSRKLIAIGSGKGGVGKSTVAANLAIALARAGHKVGLIDADIYGPSQPTLLGTDAKPEARDDRLIPVEAHGLKFLSLGQLVSPGHALAWRGPMATGALARLVEADWGDAELLLVDLPPGTGGAEEAAAEMGVPFLGRLPLSLAIREASDAGRPPAASEGEAAEPFAALAQQLLESLETPVH
jgi:ATP-binding protein involved in chromosome partitioning